MAFFFLVQNSLPAKTTDIYLSFVLETLTLSICIIANNIFASNCDCNCICNCESQHVQLDSSRTPAAHTAHIPFPAYRFPHPASRCLLPVSCCPDECVLRLGQDLSNVLALRAPFVVLVLVLFLVGAKIDSIGFVVIRSKVNVNVVAGRTETVAQERGGFSN